MVKKALFKTIVDILSATGFNPWIAVEVLKNNTRLEQSLKKEHRSIPGVLSISIEFERVLFCPGSLQQLHDLGSIGSGRHGQCSFTFVGFCIDIGFFGDQDFGNIDIVFLGCIH